MLRHMYDKTESRNHRETDRCDKESGKRRRKKAGRRNHREVTHLVRGVGRGTGRGPGVLAGT